MSVCTAPSSGSSPVCSILSLELCNDNGQNQTAVLKRNEVNMPHYIISIQYAALLEAVQMIIFDEKKNDDFLLSFR